MAESIGSVLEKKIQLSSAFWTGFGGGCIYAHLSSKQASAA